MGCSYFYIATFIYWLNKITRIAHALSLVNSCVWMRVCRHGCNITLILIGFVLSDAHFDWLVGYMIVYEENLFHSRSKKTVKVFWEVFIKALGLFFHVYIAPSKHSTFKQTLSAVEGCITVLNSRNNPLCLGEAM